MGGRAEDISAHLREAISTINQLRQQRDELLRQASEPIAVIGMGCRFPGGGNDPQSFWDALLRGVDAVREIPIERWPPNTPPPTVPGTRWAGLLDRVDQFDARFFGISPREAASLDPQQRLLLEVVWEALEDAGQPPDRLAGSRAGVFVGIMHLEYRDWVEATDSPGLDAYCTTGNALSAAAGRISYALGLQGPSVALDTACSSSLAAVHLACQSLRSGECTLAIAGGVNLIVSALNMQRLALTQALSPDGRCRTFDARANGTARGEGCGAVILKRLSDARRDRDPILALIRGSAINHVGRSTGFTAPSPLSQTELLRHALENARVAPGQIGYIEAHGTGTALGDPIELEALTAVLGAPRRDGTKCFVSSVKTNLGHLEAAAGVAGLIKTILVLQHQRIPRHLHFQTLNPRIELADTPFVIPLTEQPFPAGDGPRFAGISSFGLSGMGAHAVLESAPRSEPRPPFDKPQEQLLALSAKSAPALRDLVQRYGDFLATPVPDDAAELADIAYTAGARRTHYPHRLAVVGTTRQQWRAALSGFVAGKTPPGLVSGHAAAGRRPKLVFVFSGQGSQWLGMGRQLLLSEPVFRSIIADCDTAIRKEAGWSLTKELHAEPDRSNLARLEFIQPMVFAIAVALAGLYRSWGIEPDAVVGQSMGEIAAAQVSGALSLADAVRVICRRSQLMQRLSGLGAVAQLDADPAEIQPLIADYAAHLAIASRNGPRSTVLSGEHDAMEACLARLQAAGVFFRRVRVDVASHSPQMELLRDDLLRSLEGVRSVQPQVAMYSTVNGRQVQEAMLDAAYWYRNLREPVLLWPTVELLRELGHTLFVELSPHPILMPALQNGFVSDNKGGTALGALRREQPERRCLQELLGELYVRGLAPKWERIHPAASQCVKLPAYPWQRERFWPERSTKQAASDQRPFAARTAQGHPLLGAPFSISTQPGARYWEQPISLMSLPYLGDHRIQGELVFPGCGYLEMAIAAARQMQPERIPVVKSMRFERMLVLNEKSEPILQTALLTTGSDQAELQISRKDGEHWLRHTACTLCWEDTGQTSPPAPLDLAALKQRCKVRVTQARHYQHMQALGIQYGPNFQGVQELWIGERETLARVDAPQSIATQFSDYHVHPGWLDACIQSAISGIDRLDNGILIAAGLGRVEVYRAPTESVWVHSTFSPHESQMSVDLLVCTPDGQPILQALQVSIQQVADTAGRPAEQHEQWLYESQWRRQPLTAALSDLDDQVWLIFLNHGGVADTICSAMQQRGAKCIQITAGEQYRQLAADRYQLNPNDSQEYDSLLREVCAHDSCTGIIHLWSMDGGTYDRGTGTGVTDEPKDTELLAQAQRHGCRSALYLVQSVLRLGLRQAPRLWFATCGTQSVTEADTGIRLAPAPLWGLAQAVAREHPELVCTRVDLSHRATDAEALRLVDELRSGMQEEKVALRGESRYVARLVHSAFQQAEAPEKARVVESGSYLISGGLTGLGLAAAECLVAHGAKHLVLFGRRGPDPAAQAAIRRMQSAGAEVVAAQIDVAHYDSVAELVARFGQTWPLLRGVIHSAMVLDDGVVSEQTWERFERVMAPKIHGSWNLHLATLRLSLDFFVCYSSSASLLGTTGQANYIAANAFLDALAHHRRLRGLPGLSINWGAFSGAGVGVKMPALLQRFAERGMQSLTPTEGNQALVRLIKGSHVQVGVIKLNLPQWCEANRSLLSSPYWSELLHRDRQHPAEEALARTRWLDDVLSAPAAARPGLLEQRLKDELSRILRLPEQQIELHLPFLQLGLDSLMAVELRNRIIAELSITIAIPFFLGDMSLGRLGPHLLAQISDAAVSREAAEEIAEGVI